MPAFLVSNVRVKDPEKFKEYSEKARSTFAPFGGEFLLRGKSEDTLVGTATPHSCGVFKFSDMAALNSWFASDAYTALGPLRDEACDMILVSYQTPPD